MNSGGGAPFACCCRGGGASGSKSPESCDGELPSPWLSWAEASGFIPTRFAASFNVPLRLLDDFFETVNLRPLTDWLDQARMWVAGLALAAGQDVATAAQRVGFQSRAAFETAFKRHHGCHPGRFARKIREIEERRLAEVKKYWQEESIPSDWRPLPLLAEALANFCSGLGCHGGWRPLAGGPGLLAELLHPVLCNSNAWRRQRCGELLARLLHQPLTDRLGAKFLSTFRYLPDPHLLCDSADRALLEYLNCPARLNSTKKPLVCWLEFIAWRDLLNLHQSDDRRAVRENKATNGAPNRWKRRSGSRQPDRRKPRKTEAVNGKAGASFKPDDPAATWLPDPGPTPAEAAMLREATLEHQTQLNIFNSALSEAEQTVLELFRDEVRETREYAKALSLDHLPFKTQQREIKKIKDRLRKKLIRWVPNWE